MSVLISVWTIIWKYFLSNMHNLANCFAKHAVQFCFDKYFNQNISTKYKFKMSSTIP